MAHDDAELPPMPSDDDAPPGNVVHGDFSAPAKSKRKPRKRRDVSTPPNVAKLLQRGAGGQILSSAANAAAILAHDPRFEDVLEYDERVGIARFVSRPPLPDDLIDARAVYPREVSDADLVRAQAFFARQYDAALGLDAISAALDVVARVRSRDPVREYLAALHWDGTPRIDTWLAEYLGADRGEYTEGVGARWLISAVARTFEPGCKADHCLVFEGKTGTGKSTALKTLAGPDDWFCDSIMAIGTKDAADSLRGPWIIELSELDALNRSELGAVKAFLTSRQDRFRSAYGRRNENHKRRVVFAGTTNEHAYLRDSTGARRFWPVRTRSIDVPAIARDRDALWAEAVARYRAGESWWPDRELERLAGDEQDRRYQGDVWDEVIGAYLGGREEVSVREIACDVLNLKVGDIEQADTNRIVRALQRARWETTGNPVRRVVDGVSQRIRVYTPVRAEPTEEVTP